MSAGLGLDAAVLMLMMLAGSQMPIQDDESGRRSERGTRGISLQGVALLAAAEPRGGRRVMLLRRIVPPRRGEGGVARSGTERHGAVQAASTREVVWITSYTHSGVAVWLHTGPVPEC